jgi:VIT1/CCC1 family predicted Fe2+/Mn2+ transporter
LPVPSLEGSEAQAYVRTIHTWRNQADAWRLEKVDRLVAEYELYPDDSRILPTKLGNLLRATEDDLKHAGDDVQSFAFRYRQRVPPRVRLQHDQYRTRLDMYCTLVFVSLFLAAITPITLVVRIGLTTAVTMGGFSLMAVVSYLAAISSAKAYCTILKQMDEAAGMPVKI